MRAPARKLIGTLVPTDMGAVSTNGVNAAVTACDGGRADATRRALGAGRAGTAVVATALLVVALAPPLRPELPLGFQPAYGVVLGALLLLPRRRWPWVLAAAATFELTVHLLLGHEGLFLADRWWSSTLAIVATPTAVASVLLWRDRRTSELVPMIRLVRFFVVTLVVGLAVPLVTLAGSGFALGTRLVAAHSAAVGMLVVPPVMFAWRRPFPAQRRRGEAIAVSLAVAGACGMVFLSPGAVQEVTRPYWVVLPMMWAALRFGLRGAAWSALVTATISLWATAAGSGPFVAASGDSLSTVVYTQLFVAVVSVAALLMASAVEDLRDHREVEARLRRQAYTDQLTGLPNRVSLLDQLDERLHAEVGAVVSVLICDIDDFKVVNDGLGHHSGDRLLVEVANRIRRCVRPQDVVGRLAGDEFVVIAEHCTPEAARSVSERILAAVAAPLDLAGSVQVRPSMSIGATSSAEATTAPELIRQADAALHRAKVEGKGRLCRFDDGLRAEVHRRVIIQADFLSALSEGQVCWQFQPELDLASGLVCNLEALSRWNHRDLGPLPPDRFIPVVEAAGRSRELFTRALDVGLGAQRDRCRHTGVFVPVSVNLSPTLLSDDGIVAKVAASLERAGAAPEALWIEVTESALEAPGAEVALSGLHDLGVALAIDDFGTGWSSMSRLAAFPWDAIKIDRRFIRELDGQRLGGRYQHLVGAIVAMARALGLTVVAEGVETPTQLELVRRLGCDVAQGWLFSPAVDQDALGEVIGPSGRWVGQGHELLDVGPVDRAEAAVSTPSSSSGTRLRGEPQG